MASSPVLPLDASTDSDSDCDVTMDERTKVARSLFGVPRQSLALPPCLKVSSKKHLEVQPIANDDMMTWWRSALPRLEVEEKFMPWIDDAYTLTHTVAHTIQNYTHFEIFRHSDLAVEIDLYHEMDSSDSLGEDDRVPVLILRYDVTDSGPCSTLVLEDCFWSKERRFWSSCVWSKKKAWVNCLCACQELVISWSQHVMICLEFAVSSSSV